jgi:hypothetical protein
MNRKNLTIILAVALIASFFLPIFKGTSASAFDAVKASAGGWQKYIFLIFPICGLLLLVGAMNRGNYPGGRGLLAWLPFLAVLWIIIISPLIDGVQFKYIFRQFEVFGIGMWVAVVSSIVLAFYNPRS